MAVRTQEQEAVGDGASGKMVPFSCTCMSHVQAAAERGAGAMSQLQFLFQTGINS